MSRSKASGRVYVELDVRTDVRGAARTFFLVHKTWPEEVTDEYGIEHEVIGGCESCGQAILATEEWADTYYRESSNGEDLDLYICGNCRSERAADALPVPDVEF